MSTITQVLCNNFGGIRQKNAVFSSEHITAKDMQNVELYYTGLNGGVGIRTQLGNISEISIQNEKIINIFQSVQNEKIFFLVHSEDSTQGKIYLYRKDTGALEIKKNGLSKTGISNGFDVRQGWSDLFFFTNGTDMLTIELEKTSGVTVETEVKTLALKDKENRSITGLGAAVAMGRLWVFSGNILWYSVMGDIYDFSTSDAEWETSAGYIETIKNITAIHPYLNSLAVFYEDSSELISVDSGMFSRSEESPGGCAGVSALVFHDTDLYFYDHTKKAVFSFKQIVTGEKVLGDNIAVEIQEMLSIIDGGSLNKIKTLSVFTEDHNEVWWIVPTDDENYSTIFIFDYLKKEWTKRKSQKINSAAIIDNVLYSAGDDGNILEEYNSNTFNGEYIQHYYNCSPFNLGAMNTLKVLSFSPRVSLDAPYSNLFYVKYVKNYNIYKKAKVKYVKTKVKDILVWGQGIWGVHFWSGKSYSTIRKLPNATFKILEIEFYTTNANESFSISNIEFSKIKVKQV